MSVIKRITDIFELSRMQQSHSEFAKFSKFIVHV